MHRLKFHPGIAEDIRESYKWYEEQSEGLGDVLIDEVERAYQAIVDFPEA